jgi:hypothetical protein
MKRASNKSNLDIIRGYLNGERPFVQISMTDVDGIQKRKEGEEWEDSRGKKWKKQNGKKTAIGKKSTIINDERCLFCNADTRFGTRYDRQVWPKTRKCYDCFIEFETLLKVRGVYDSYVRNRDLSYLRSSLLDFKPKLEETLKWCQSDSSKKLQYLNDDGSPDTWKDNTDSVKSIQESAEKDLSLVNDRLSDVEKEFEQLSVNMDVVKMCEKELKKKYKNGRNESSPVIELGVR